MILTAAFFGRAWIWAPIMGIVAMALAVVYLVQQTRTEAALLRADPEQILQHRILVRFAVSQAKPAFAQHCASCHGARLEGDPRLGVPSLASGARLYGAESVAEIERTILYGIRSGNPKGRNLASMPAYARPEPYAREKIEPLMPPQMRDVVDYLRTLENRPADQAAAARGAAIFSGKGGCYDCHGGDGRGDPAIGAPDLTDNVWLYGDGSRESVSFSIAYGRHGACPAWIGRLRPATIRALAVYIRSRFRPPGGPEPSPRPEDDE